MIGMYERQRKIIYRHNYTSTSMCISNPLHDRFPTCRLKVGYYEPDLQNSQNLQDNLREGSETTLYHDNVYLSLGASLNNRNRTAMNTPRPKNKPLLTGPKLQL